MAVFQYGMLVQGVTSTATAGGTTSLTLTSTQIQAFTGTLAQTVKLPATTGMAVGQFFEIYNNSTGSITLQFQDASSFTANPTIQASASVVVKLLSAGTTNGTWLVLSGPSFVASTISFSNGIIVTGGTVATPGGLSYSSSLGLALSAKTGSVDDFAIVNAANTGTVMTVPTGTSNANFSGTVTSTFPGLGFQAIATNNGSGVIIRSKNTQPNGNTADTAELSAQNNNSDIVRLVMPNHGLTGNSLGGTQPTGPYAYLATTTSNGLSIGTNSLAAINIDTSQNSTFTGTITNASAITSQRSGSPSQNVVISGGDSGGIYVTGNSVSGSPKQLVLQSLVATGSPISGMGFLLEVGTIGGSNTTLLNIDYQGNTSITGYLGIGTAANGTDNLGLGSTIGTGTSASLWSIESGTTFNSTGTIKVISSDPTVTTNTASQLISFFAGQPTFVSSGAASNIYGFYSNVSAGTNNYAFYSPTAAQSILNGPLTLATTSNAILTLGSQNSAGNGAAIKFIPSSTATNWLIGSNFDVAGALEFTPSTAGGGSTFTTPVMTLVDGGLVGIGNTNPTYTLDVAKSTTAVFVARIQNTSTSTSSDAVSALDLVKGSTTATSGTNRFIEFDINAGSTGSGYIATAGTNTAGFFASSDARLKTNIVPLTGSLELISQLTPVTYNWKSDNSSATGFIAQDFAKVLPKMVHQTDDGSGTDLPANTEAWSMTESGMVPYLVQAIQELKAQFDAYVAAHP